MHAATPIFLAILAATVPGLAAHGGEDHGAPPAATPGSGGARVAEAQTDAFEGVLKFKAADVSEPLAIHLFLSDYATNAPVIGATITLSIPDLKLDVKAEPSTAMPGLYEVIATPAQAGTFPTIATITVDGGTDLLLFDAVVFGPDAEAAVDSKPRRSWPGVVGIIVAILAGILVGFMLRRPGRRVASMLLLALLMPWSSSPARAHGGEDHGAAPKSAGPTTIAYVSKEAQISFVIRTVVAEPVELPGRRSWRGSVVASPNGKAEVIAVQAGRVVAVEGVLPQVGDIVRKGQPLLAIEGYLSASEQIDVRTALAEAEARQVAAAQELLLAERQRARYEALADVVSRRERDEADARLETARAMAASARRAHAVLSASTTGTSVSAARYVLTAPIDGVISSGSATIGEAVEAGRHFFSILDTRSFWVRMDVPESDAGTLGLQPRAPARIVVPGSPTTPIGARFVSMGRTVDAATRTVPAFLEADGSSGLLLEGQLVEVHVDAGTTTTGFLVPASAIVEITGKPTVFAHVHAEEFAPRDVVLGLTAGDQVEVLSGLRAGDRIVISGAFQVRAALMAGR